MTQLRLLKFIYVAGVKSAGAEFKFCGVKWGMGATFYGVQVGGGVFTFHVVPWVKQETFTDRWERAQGGKAMGLEV